MWFKTWSGVEESLLRSLCMNLSNDATHDDHHLFILYRWPFQLNLDNDRQCPVQHHLRQFYSCLFIYFLSSSSSSSVNWKIHAEDSLLLSSQSHPEMRVQCQRQRLKDVDCTLDYTSARKYNWNWITRYVSRCTELDRWPWFYWMVSNGDNVISGEGVIW